MKYFYPLLFVLFLLNSCKNKEEQKATSTKHQEQVTPKENPAKKFAKVISAIHHTQDFYQEEAISFRLDLKFGNKQRMNAKITMQPDFTKLRIDKEDGTTLIFNGKDIYLSPKEKNYPQARFDMFTWPYFFSLAYKLNDKGTQWSKKMTRELNGEIYETATLKFDDNVGDAPDDWYIVYANKTTNLLRAAAYIVTYNKDVEEAEKNPHAIVYEDYFTVKMLPIAKKWKFYNWSEEKGIYGDAIGEAEVSNITFPKLTEKTFTVPDDAVKVKKQ